MFDINIGNINVKLVERNDVEYSYSLKGDEKRLTIAAGKIFRSKNTSYGKWRIEGEILILSITSPPKMSFSEIKNQFTQMVTI